MYSKSSRIWLDIFILSDPSLKVQKIFYLVSKFFVIFTAKNTLISPNFLVWKICGNAQFPQSFGRLASRFIYNLSLNQYSRNAPPYLRPATLLKKRLWYRCFPVNFAKFPRTTFLQNTSGRLLLY